ncbi:MAG TPA: hypothetical protein VIM11_21530 [Tepidisphaeraceae bacterium]|jgi:hypothetical protein
MATFGGYETVHEIYRHGLGSVARAKIASPADGSSGEPDFVVKAFQPPVRIAGQDAIKPAVRSFLDRARIQQDVVTAGATHWAPIYEAGAARDGAYYVTAYYSRSALKLITGRVKLSSQSLYVLTKSILMGLSELKQYCGQPHGNLKAANVLVGGEGEIEAGKIHLTDPASREQLPAADGEAADLVAVGELVYQFVLHRPFRGSQSWPVMESPEWARLGKKADAWRKFCNQLLNPTESGSLQLETVLKDLEGLRERRGLFSGPRMRIAGLAAVLGIIAFCGWSYLRFRADWKELCVQYYSWYDKLDTELRADPARLARLKSDPYLAGAITELQGSGTELDPKKIAGNELLVMTSLADRPPLSYSAAGKTRAALNALRKFEDELSPEQWPFLHELTVREQVYKDRRWTAAAKYLRQLIDEAKLDVHVHGDLAANFDHLIANQAKVKHDLALVEDQWQVIANTLKTISGKAPDDKVLKKFEPFATRYVDSALNGAPMADPHEVSVAVTPVAGFAETIGALLQWEWNEKIDHDRFAHEGKVYHSPKTVLTEEDFSAWLKEVQDFYYIKLTPESEPIAQLMEMSKQVSAEINSLQAEVPTEPPQAIGLYQKRLADTAASVKTFLGRRWVQKDRTVAIPKVGGDLQVAISSLRDEVIGERLKHTVDQTKWWKDAGNDIAASSAVNTAWGDWRNRLGVDPTKLPTMPLTDFHEIQVRVDAITKALRDVDKQFPAASGQAGPFATLAKAKREAKLTGVLGAAATSADGPPNLEKLRTEAQKAGAEYAAWCADLTSILADANHAKTLLDGAFVPSDAEASDMAKFRDKWSSHEVWRDVSSMPPVDSVIARLKLLDEISKLSREALAARAAAGDAASAELMRAAWLALGRLEFPRWPATDAQLRQEIQIRQKLAVKIEGLGDAFRKKPLREELQKQGSIRLAAYLNTVGAAPSSGAQIEANLKAADAAIEPMGLTPGTSGAATPFDRYRRLAALETLDPAVKLNLLLAGLRVMSANPALTRDQLSVIADGFKQEVARSPASMQSSAGDLLKGFAKLGEPESASGPPLSQWRKTADPGERRIVYTLSSDATQTLEFVRLEIPGKQPTYLCTTELSLGAFMAAIPPSDWARGGGLLVEYQAKYDPRPGPRGWDWTTRGDASSPPITASDYWLRGRTDGLFDYFRKDKAHPLNHPSLDADLGDNPMNRFKIPMQYLPAPTAFYVASQLGCRLPTSQEWKLAYATVGEKGNFNLRDETWQKQQVYVKQVNVPSKAPVLEWPDAGAFRPRAADIGATGPNAKPFTNSDDHVLWFRDVDAPDGQVFHNLVGNVWEYVWEDPAALESVTDKSVRGWRSLIEGKVGQLAVIGGSALSGPELDQTKPQPVELPAANNSTPPDVWSGFADVGVRLAFTVHPNSPAERLAWLMSRQPYVGATDAPTVRPKS